MLSANPSSTGCGKSVSVENDMFRAAMLLYYCCGLRKSEAQNLKVMDVDLDSGKIAIWNSKNDVSRIVVASETLLTALRDYVDRYLKTASDDSFFSRIQQDKDRRPDIS